MTNSEKNKQISTNKDPKLSKQLKPSYVWAIAFGCIIGWGSFINPGKKFLPNSGVAGTAIAMVLGAIVMIIIAASYQYLVPKFPKAGGEFVFTQKSVGKIAAFICGWFLLSAYLTNVPMNSTAISLIVDGLDGSLDILKWGFHYQIAGYDVYAGEAIVAGAILLLFGFLNIIGVQKAGFIQTILTVLLASSVGLLLISAFVSGKFSVDNMQPLWGFDKSAAIAAGATTENIQQFAHVGPQGIASAILATFAITPWAFVGFDTIPQAAEEFNFSHKKVAFICVVAILFGCFVYVSNNTVAAACLQNWPDKVISGEWVLLIAAQEIMGPFGMAVVGIAVSCAVLSGIMGFYLASSRLMFAMARDGYLPKVFGKVDKKYHTPKNAMIFCIIVSMCGPILGREALGWFVDMSSIGASIGFFFSCLAALILMKRYGDGSMLLKFACTLGTIFSACFVFMQLVPIPGLEGVHFCTESYIMFVVWIFVGAFFFWKMRKSITT